MKKTEAKPGKPVVLKLREDEQQLVLDWINAQTVHGDSLRYLIQKDIAENGIRNLQLIIPQYRDIEVMRSQINATYPDDSHGKQYSPLSPVHSAPAEIKKSEDTTGNTTSNVGNQEVRIDASVNPFLETPNVIINDSPSIIGQGNQELELGNNTEVPSGKRAARKSYDDDVIKSYQ